MASKHESISDALVEDILSGRYRAGERLPSERDLAVRFDANRGAVREAMKRLEQLGLTSILPGGARVNPLEAASLDVVSHLLGRGDLPDEDLVDQILTVVSGLVSIAADAVVQRANPGDIEQLRVLLQPLINEELDPLAHQDARFQLMGSIMELSGNLVCRLIARTLLEQLVPNMQGLEPYAQTELDRSAYKTSVSELDLALAQADARGVRCALDDLSSLNRATVMRAFAAAKANGVTIKVAI